MPDIFQLCKKNGCRVIVKNGTLCPVHLAEQKDAEKATVSEYNKQTWRRDQSNFYAGVKWRRLRAMFLNHNPMCERCKDQGAQMVHHIKPLAEYPENGYEWDNLMALCNSCHEAIEQEAGNRH